VWTIKIGTELSQIDRSEYFDVDAFSVERQINGRAIFRGRVRDPYGTPPNYYAPTENQVLILEQDGEVEFGGIITEVSTAPVFGDVGMVTGVVAADYNIYPSRVYIDNLVLDSEVSDIYLIDALQALIADYLGQFGVTLYLGPPGGQQAGPQLLGTIEWDQKSVEEALNEMGTATGWVWRIDHNKTLWMYDPTTQNCPIQVSEAAGEACNPDMVVTRNSSLYANRIKLRIGSAAAVEKTSNWVANGVTRSWQTNYIPVEPLPATATFYVGSTGHLLGQPSDLQFSWSTGLRSVVQASGYSTIAADTALSFTYDAQFPMLVQAEDPSGIALYGLTERFFNLPDCYDFYSGVTIAEGLLRKAIEIQTEIQFSDYRTQFMPGQVLNVNLPNRGVNEDFLLTSVDIRAESQYVLKFTVKAVAGSEQSGNWMEKFRQWASMSGGGGSGGFGGFGGDGGGTALGAWYLGGSRFHAVRIPE
jgi:hypothetical protein